MSWPVNYRDWLIERARRAAESADEQSLIGLTEYRARQDRARWRERFARERQDVTGETR